MNELNKTDSQSLEKSKTNTPPTPSNKLIKEFKKLFTKAEKSINKTADAEKKETASTKEPTEKKETQKSANETIKKSTFEFKKDDPLLNQIFNEMGINSIKQIETLIIQITNKVEEATKTPHVNHTFSIQWENNQRKLRIEPLKTPQGFKINLTCDKALFALISAYLPELKSHLKKKNIEIDDIILNEDSGEENELQEISKKNNI
tara:strand:+ start:104 stop:718 length:615 start_codon:yes stop_codon:yes gene_type:complete